MKVIIDVSNIKVGGGLQASISTINNIIEINDDNEYFFILSERVASQLNLDKMQYYSIINTGFSTLLPFSSSKKRIKKLVHDYDVVFTIFGPCFWGKSEKHLIGFANAWIVSPNSIAYQTLNYKDKIVNKIKYYVLSKILFDKSCHYVTETEIVKDLFINYFNTFNDNISVVSNTLPYIYDQNDQNDQNKSINDYVLPNKFGKYFKFISITNNYPHKNLKIIEDVGRELFNQGYYVLFIVTIDHKEYESLSESFKKHTYNFGPVSVKDSLKLYSLSDALFLPTLIECFTVSYLEAMANKLPIVTSDLDFAHDLCGNSAIYFNPLDYVDIANKIITLINSEKNYLECVNKGEVQLKKYPNSKQRTSLYLKLINQLGNK